MSHCPWTYRALAISGDEFLPCCRFQGNFVIEKNDLHYSYNSGKISEFRQRLDQGEKLKECNDCWLNENMGIKSMRQQGLDMWGEVKTPEIQFVELDLDNTCNLKCVSCNSRQSSSLATEEIKLYGKKVFTERKVTDHFKQLDFSKLKIVKLIGGEPFLSKKITDACQYILDNGIEKDLELWISTNCTVLPNDTVQNLMMKCRQLHLNLSIDGYKDLNNFVRNDTLWEDVTGNLEKFNRYIDKRTNKSTFININFVAHLYNANKIHELQNWIQRNFPKFSIEITPLIYPKFLSLIYAPASYKIYLENYFKEHNLSKLELLLKESDQDLFDYFCAYHNLLVAIRQKDISESNPELFDYIKKYMPIKQISKEEIFSLRTFESGL